jgi:hypothetical protein
MIANEVQEGFIHRKTLRAANRVCVTTRLSLLDESQPSTNVCQKPGVGLLIAGPDHDTDVADSGSHRLSYYQTEHRALRSILVEERLHWQIALISARSSDYGLSDLHVEHSIALAFLASSMRTLTM